MNLLLPNYNIIFVYACAECIFNFSRLIKYFVTSFTISNGLKSTIICNFKDFD